MDIWDKNKRSEVMSKIRSKDTKPEIILRKALFAKGYRYRINYKKLPGKPDIVLPKYKTAIFVNGCFWHGHENCSIAHIPKTNTAFWQEKITRNQERDHSNIQKIIDKGWKVLVVWECEIMDKKQTNSTISITEQFIKQPIEPTPSKIKVTVYDYIHEDIQIVAENIIPYSKRKH